MRRPALPWAEIVILAGAVAVVFALSYATVRRQAETAPRFDTYSSYDAHKGGYRAWYELLQREGMKVERFRRRAAFLDASVGTLIVAPNSNELMLRAERGGGEAAGELRDVDYEKLLSWVKAGGRLVWVTDQAHGGKFELPSVSEGGTQTDQAVRVAQSPLTADVDAVAGSGTLRVALDGAASVLPLVADGGGAVVAQRSVGKGSIVVVSDQSLFDNAHIAKAGNARLAYNLAAGSRRGSVAFDEWVHGFESGDTWWAVLPVPARAALIIILVAIGLLLLGTTFRFGPTTRLPENAERTSAEYLSSMAQLLARGRAARSALRSLSSATLHDVARAVGLSDQAPLAAIVARVEGGDDGPQRAAAVRELAALRALERPSDADLLRAAALCATLRKDNTRYGRIGFGRRATPVRRTA